MPKGIGYAGKGAPSEEAMAMAQKLGKGRRGKKGKTSRGGLVKQMRELHAMKG